MSEHDETPVAISYSGGASSEWLIQAVINGWLSRPKHLAVFFADTGWEHEWTYEAVERVESQCKSAGIDFVRCAHKKESLPQHLLALKDGTRTRADHPPFWLLSPGGGRGRAEHRCTREFKVAPMRRAQAAWLKALGLPKRITKWVGFGLDEMHRANKAVARQAKDVLWERLEFPAIAARLTRNEQRASLKMAIGFAPRFSMCTGCPFKDPDRWRATPENQLPLVYEVDEAIRDLDQIGLTESEAYLCSRMTPVERLIKKGDPQPNLPGLESYCDGGACFL